MAYTKQQWRDGPTGQTPIDAAHLSVIEQGISDAHDAFAPAAFKSSTQTALAGGVVTADMIADNSVGSAEIATGAVTPSELSDAVGVIRAVLPAVPTGTDAEKAAALDAAGIPIGGFFGTLA